MACNIPCLTIGRIIVGVAGGISNVCYSKFIYENMPEKLASMFGICLNASCSIGIIPCLQLGGILPDPNDLQANRDDSLWRVIYIVPAIIGFITSLLVIFVFTEEPISFCIMNGLDEEGKRHMKRVYSKKDPTTSEPIEDILASQYKFQKRGTTLDAGSTSFGQATCGRKYRKATWITFIIASFNQQTGITAILSYVTRLL